MSGDRPVIGQILGDAYASDLETRSLQELRDMRDGCDEVETELSYSRRLLQGRIDILRDEAVRRREGTISSPADLVSRLPSILSEGPQAPRGNRLMRMLAPAQMEAVEQEVEDLLGMSLGDIATADGPALDDALHRLEEAEREVSRLRRILHERLDAIQAEMARRYRDGEADVDSLLKG
ncbi:MAG: aerial mycelium formation protein [Acidimicrobiia bacterium]|nr:aerial mycelium formation protein [Acidimicrobiia bacterium]